MLTPNQIDLLRYIADDGQLADWEIKGNARVSDALAFHARDRVYNALERRGLVADHSTVTDAGLLVLKNLVSKVTVMISLSGATEIDVVDWALEAQQALGDADVRELHDVADDVTLPVHSKRTGRQLWVYSADWLEDLLYRLEEQARDMADDWCTDNERRSRRAFAAAGARVAARLRLAAPSAGGSFKKKVDLRRQVG